MKRNRGQAPPPIRVAYLDHAAAFAARELSKVIIKRQKKMELHTKKRARPQEPVIVRLPLLTCVSCGFHSQ